MLLGDWVEESKTTYIYTHRELVSVTVYNIEANITLVSLQSVPFSANSGKEGNFSRNPKIMKLVLPLYKVYSRMVCIACINTYWDTRLYTAQG